MKRFKYGSLFTKGSVHKMTLQELETGKSARILTVGGQGALRQHFLDMGLIPGAKVTLVKYAPMGDPMELLLHGYELTLRLADAENILVEPINENDEEHKKEKVKKREIPHPGLGEGESIILKEVDIRCLRERS